MLANDSHVRRLPRWTLFLATFAGIALVAACSRQVAGTGNDTTHGRTLAQVAQGMGLEVGDARVAPAMGAGRSAGEKDLAMLGVQGGHTESALLAQTKTSEKDKDLAERTIVPPGPDDWHIITNSLTLFRHAPFVADLLLGLTVSVLGALALTSTPRRAVRYDPVAELDQRKATVLVALIGCIAAQLVEASEQFLLGAEIALVLFGIGGLVRFRTLFGDARETGTAIIAAILGLAAGMSEYSLVLLGLAFVYLVNWWLSSTAVVRVRVRAGKHADLAQVQSALGTLLQQQEFVVQRSTASTRRREVEVYAATRRDFELEALTETIEHAIPDARVRVSAS
ncbi:MAG: hypothetical protein U0625_04290 [Phycisphaerales bacterium]